MLRQRKPRAPLPAPFPIPTRVAVTAEGREKLRSSGGRVVPQRGHSQHHSRVTHSRKAGAARMEVWDPHPGPRSRGRQPRQRLQTVYKYICHPQKVPAGTEPPLLFPIRAAWDPPRPGPTLSPTQGRPTAPNPGSSGQPTAHGMRPGGAVGAALSPLLRLSPSAAPVLSALPAAGSAPYLWGRR